MATHLGQAIADHVTLESVSGINGGFGDERRGWTRVLPNGQSFGENFVVPAKRHLVITDLDWQYDNHGTTHANRTVTLRLLIVAGDPSDVHAARRLLESSITLSAAGTGGTVTSWTSGGVFGPGTRIGIDTSPLQAMGGLQHALLHGYLIGPGSILDDILPSRNLAVSARLK